MASDELTTPRSRRALLAAAAGAAGAFAANAAMPLTAAAAPANMQTESPNFTTLETSITDSGADSNAFASNATGTGFGYGLLGTSAGGGGVVGWSVSEPSNTWFDPDLTGYTGVFGYSPTNPEIGSAGAGVWGDSEDIGVAGSGAVGVYGYGSTGVIGEAASSVEPGVLAYGLDGNSPALQVVGKVRFSRSGRKAMASGSSSALVYLGGVTTTSKVFAVLATNEPGRWVRAVLPAAGRFRIYLNTTLSSSAVVSWFVLD